MSLKFKRVLMVGHSFLKSIYREMVRPEFTTEILKIDCKYVGGWIGGCWGVENESGGYHGLLKKWWDHFGLKGRGLVIGEEGINGENVKKKLKDTYPNTEVLTASLNDADVIWDITRPLKVKRDYDWIICQAVLEHVKDPVAAVKNMTHVLKKNGYIFIHTHSPEFEYHPYPVDCYRFFRDAFVALAEVANLEIVDIFWEPRHCFVAFKKA